MITWPQTLYLETKVSLSTVHLLQRLHRQSVYRDHPLIKITVCRSPRAYLPHYRTAHDIEIYPLMVPAIAIENFTVVIDTLPRSHNIRQLRVVRRNIERNRVELQVICFHLHPVGSSLHTVQVIDTVSPGRGLLLTIESNFGISHTRTLQRKKIIKILLPVISGSQSGQNCNTGISVFKMESLGMLGLDANLNIPISLKTFNPLLFHDSFFFPTNSNCTFQARCEWKVNFERYFMKAFTW